VTAALETVGLQKRFGGILAAQDVSIRLSPGARHALIGPNGAGKTTILNLISGILAATQGQVLLEGKDVSRLAPHRRVRLGLARTFQINQLFPEFTPLESLTVALSERGGPLCQPWRRAGAAPALADEIAEIAEWFGLADALNTRTAALGYGSQRLLEIALAVACRPRVLLLDEPAAGIPEADRRQLLQTISALPRGIAVLLVEHDMDLVFGFAERISVLVNGAVLAEGTPREIARDPRVRAAYLGEAADA
jgi:branched-chain amino acid transport system ATP-binding protein